MELKRHFFLFMLASTLSGFATADNFVISKENLDVKSTENYWTPDRLRNAQPLPPLKVNANMVNQDTLPSNVEIIGDNGQPPVVDTIYQGQQLYTPIKEKQTTQSMFKTMFNRGSLNENFSSSRLIPLTADTTYPYRTVGKLFFTIPGRGDYVCSASVLRPRVVLTAGHCVHRGSGGRSGFYTNWLFVPAFRDGAAPLQSWKWKYVATTNTWQTGGGSVPNAADYAMLEMEDKTISGSLRKIGAITGYLGYQTASLIPNHAHLLGYPCNLDSCQKMHQVTAQSARTISPNNVEYGSDMGGGSSGGPWVQNFGVASAGQTGGTNTGINRVIGVTSFGYVDPAALAEGASILDKRFITLLNTVCGHRAGNCS